MIEYKCLEIIILVSFSLGELFFLYLIISKQYSIACDLLLLRSRKKCVCDNHQTRWLYLFFLLTLRLLIIIISMDAIHTQSMLMLQKKKEKKLK